MVYSNFWQFDKIDKIVISLIFIVVTMFSIFNCFCFATSEREQLYFTKIRDLSTSGDGVFAVSTSGGNTGYVEMLPGYRYILTIGENVNCGVVLSNAIPSPGVPYDFLTKLSSPGQQLIYDNVAEKKYLYLDVSWFPTNYTLYSEPIPSFDYAISSLVDNVGVGSLWNVFEVSLPWVLVVVLFVFGWWFFSHWVKELGKGREF